MIILPHYGERDTTGHRRTPCGRLIATLGDSEIVTEWGEVNCDRCNRVMRRHPAIYPDGPFREAGRRVGKKKSRGRHVANNDTPDTTDNTNINGGTEQVPEQKDKPSWQTNSLFAPIDVGPRVKATTSDTGTTSQYPEGWL